jgi:hypothetical protein
VQYGPVVTVVEGVFLMDGSIRSACGGSRCRLPARTKAELYATPQANERDVLFVVPSRTFTFEEDGASRTYMRRLSARYSDAAADALAFRSSRAETVAPACVTISVDVSEALAALDDWRVPCARPIRGSVTSSEATATSLTACPACDTPFLPKRKDQRGCSSSCSARLRKRDSRSKPEVREAERQRERDRTAAEAAQKALEATKAVRDRVASFSAIIDPTQAQQQAYADALLRLHPCPEFPCYSQGARNAISKCIDAQHDPASDHPLRLEPDDLDDEQDTFTAPAYSFADYSVHTGRVSFSEACLSNVVMDLWGEAQLG